MIFWRKLGSKTTSELDPNNFHCMGKQNTEVIYSFFYLFHGRKKAIDVYNDVNDNHIFIFGFDFLFYEYLVSSFYKNVLSPCII